MRGEPADLSNVNYLLEQANLANKEVDRWRG
jgi:hypothetical protein